MGRENRECMSYSHAHTTKHESMFGQWYMENPQEKYCTTLAFIMFFSYAHIASSSYYIYRKIIVLTKT